MGVWGAISIGKRGAPYSLEHPTLDRVLLVIEVLLLVLREAWIFVSFNLSW